MNPLFFVSFALAMYSAVEIRRTKGFFKFLHAVSIVLGVIAMALGIASLM
jgi:hypothetical protein